MWKELLEIVLSARLITSAIRVYLFAKYRGANELFRVSQSYFGPVVTAPRVNVHVPVISLREETDF